MLASNSSSSPNRIPNYRAACERTPRGGKPHGTSATPKSHSIRAGLSHAREPAVTNQATTQVMGLSESAAMAHQSYSQMLRLVLVGQVRGEKREGRWIYYLPDGKVAKTEEYRDGKSTTKAGGK